MRTKALILAAAVSAMGVASSMAQVYSVNAVGYINITCVPGFNMIANQLNASPNNSLSSVIPTAPDGAQVYNFVPGSGYTTATYDELLPGWDQNFNVAPGGGVWFRNNQAGPITLTLVGEVPQGTLNNSVNAGFSLRSSMVPQAGNADVLGLSAATVDGDQVSKFTPGSGYSTFTRDTLEPSGWSPSVPTFAVGEAFWLNLVAPTTWSRTFSVN
jgi:hypothetical protein